MVRNSSGSPDASVPDFLDLDQRGAGREPHGEVEDPHGPRRQGRTVRQAGVDPGTEILQAHPSAVDLLDSELVVRDLGIIEGQPRGVPTRPAP